MEGSHHRVDPSVSCAYQVWYEDLPKEVAVIQNQACLHGTQHSHTGWKAMHYSM